MNSVLFGILCFMAMNSFPALAAREPQTVNPQLDASLLANFPDLFQSGQNPPDIFNILILGQDENVAGKGRDKRRLLGSRSDIIMVLSLNRVTMQHTILSVYRDFSPTAACVQGMGRSSPDLKINGVYSILGRRSFIPCISAMLADMVNYLPAAVASQILDSRGQLPIHAFFEGTRSQTIRPMGEDVVSVVSNNKREFIGTYGIMQTSSALAVLLGNKLSGNGPSYLLGSDLSEEDARKMVNDKYLKVELKERYIYPAGGYQRAFNLASVVTNLLGWAGYGIEQYRSQNFDFLGRFFGDVVNDNMSRSIDFKVLENEVFMRNGDHLLRTTCYNSGVSPIRIVQWGESPRSFSIYENGKFSRSHASGLINKLKFVKILPNPSDCN